MLVDYINETVHRHNVYLLIEIHIPHKLSSKRLLISITWACSKGWLLATMSKFHLIQITVKIRTIFRWTWEFPHLSKRCLIYTVNLNDLIYTQNFIYVSARETVKQSHLRINTR
jgi:hypothetical protein